MYTRSLIVTFLCILSTKACVVNDIDLSILEKYSPWKSASDDKNTSYMIKLCGSLTTFGGNSDCHSNTHICMTRKNDPKFTKPLSTANTTETSKPVNQKHNETGELWIIAAGDNCPDDTSENLTSVINLKCGLTMGSPEFLEYTACTSYFEWQTSAVCKDVTKKAVKEVPCYVYDDNNEKFDLSQLTKSYDGYLVDSTEAREFYINVCRDITGGAKTAKCPKGSAACQINGDKVIDMGQPDSKLQRNINGNLELHYTSNQTTPGCTVNPSTRIEFICPKQGGSKEPLLTYDFNCQYKVMWYTEHACGESVITSDTCRITQEDRNIDIDLSPLTRDAASNHPYSTEALPRDRYFINVCEKLGIQCPDSDHVKDVGACQTKFESAEAHIIGKIDHQLLRYADGALTLTYRGGDICGQLKVQSTTVINFICNETAINNGKGTPVFDQENDCSYFFNWETKYACLNHPVDSECRASFQGKRFDLSPLVRHSGKNWEVLDADINNKKNRYFINMCNDLLIEGDAGRCHPDASVCMIDDKDKVHNLGVYTANPVYDNNTNLLQITFSNGDKCKEDTSRKKSIVTFICKPGDLVTGPIFLRSSLDECIYEFEWYTASACTLLHSSGDNCRVVDTEAGISFDLSKLTKPSGQYYNITTDKYNYLINVCDKVTNVTSCGTQPNPGVCQVSKDPHGSSFNTGQMNAKLQYYDGFINLTYTNGDPYNSQPPQPRTTEIAFLCDRDANIGHPEFVGEDHGYSFKWFTSYACPNPPVECTVIDSIRNLQYDLSSLSKSGTQDNWEIMDDHNPNRKTKYYINVCRPVTEVMIGKGCATFAAACQSTFDSNGKETIDDVGTNKGEVTNGPQVEGEGRLYLQYKTSSKLCTEDNGNKSPFLTTIHFLCTKGALTKGPNIPIQVSNCEQSIIWETEAACPLAVEEKESCTIDDPNSEFTFNLQPLKKTGDNDYYKVLDVTNGKTYRINICGGISKSNCDYTNNQPSSMCVEGSGGSNPGLANMDKYKLYFADDGQMTLNYYGTRNTKTGVVTEVIILFLCEQTMEYGVPIFERKDEEKYFFKFTTSLACAPKFVDCVAQDSKGNQYDLTNLARIHDWDVTDQRTGHSDLTYHINVCRPVNTVSGTNCPGGPIGGCQTTAHGESFNMGYIQSKPVVIGDGTLVIRYRNGDICHKGTPQQSHRSTRITFMCSQVQHDPVFEGETEECEYIFHWMTPHACVQTPIHTGANCKVSDPLYNYEFDLSPLKQATDYKVTVGEYTYILNVCQGLTSKGTGCGADVANCQTKPADASFHMDAGHVNSSLVYDEGEITLTYLGGQPCHDAKYTRKTIITFSCDQSPQSGKDGPQFVTETSECVYQFVWATQFACPPFRMGTCSAHDSTTGKTYDLSSLAMTDDNYEDVVYTEKKKYIFNVCRSLVHQKGQTCPFYSAVCEIDLVAANNSFHNLGEVNAQQVVIDNDKVELYYTNGDLCEDGKTKMSTRIIFYCNPSVKDSHPSGHFKVGCEHHFVWSTEAGCPVGETVGKNCTVTNQVTGHVFNLSPLSVKTVSIDDNRGHTFQLQVCKPLPTTTCASSSGACQVEKSSGSKWNAGNANGNVNFDDGVLVLNYTGGTPCHNNKFTRNTVINFICSPGAGEGTPTFVDESEDCTYFIYWKTELACEERVLCSVNLGNSEVMDLSPLIKRSGHHLALSMASNTKNETFYINVCEPLNPIYDTLCPPGSGACYVKPGSDPVGLGKLKSRPYKDPMTGKIVLNYVNGTKCPSDPSKNASSKIIFTCNPGPSQGQPIFESVSSDCVYTFLWDTNVVCEDSDLEVPLKDCTYKDPSSGLSINLKDLKITNPFTVTVTDTLKYLVSVCDKVTTTVPGCGTTSICKVENNKGFAYGSVSSGEFLKTEDILHMAYKNGQVCDGSKTKSEGIIQFKCNPDSPNPGNPTVLSVTPCQAIFLWETRLMCPTVATDCSISYSGHIYDLSLLSSKTKSWEVKDTTGNQYWLNICEGVHSVLDSDKCPLTAAACRKTPSGTIDTLGLISSQTLRMDSDGKTLILEYTHGNSACSHTKKRSNNLPATIRVKFECGKIVGGPVYVSGSSSDSSCVFEFKWKSSVACSIEREEVTEENNLITDPRSQAKIDLNNITRTFIVQDGPRTFYIDTKGSAMGCSNAVVCLHTDNKPNSVNIGNVNKRKFYIEDDILQAEYSSDEKCEFDSSKSVTSIIQFKCNDNNETSVPILLSESRDCVYLFVWETQHTCLSPNVVIPTPTSGGSVPTGSSGKATQEGKTSSGGVGGGKIAIIVTVFAVAIIVCVLLIVFHKAERRAAFRLKVASLFGREGRQRALYNVLPSVEEDGDGNENDEVLLLANEEQMASSLQRADRLRTKKTSNSDVKILNPFEDAEGGYHDDSDEDMLA